MPVCQYNISEYFEINDVLMAYYSERVRYWNVLLVRTQFQSISASYKIKFISGEYEYSCDVDTGSGDIVKFDKQPKH